MERVYIMTSKILQLFTTELKVKLLYDRPILSTESTPHDKQKSNCLDHNKHLVMSPGGAQRQGRLTD